MTQENLVKRAYQKHLEENFDDPTLKELWNSGSVVKFEIKPKYNSLDTNKINVRICERRKIDNGHDIKLFRTISYPNLKDFFTLVGFQQGIKCDKGYLIGIHLKSSQYDAIYQKLITDKAMITLTFFKKSIEMAIEKDPNYENSQILLTSNLPKIEKIKNSNRDLQSVVDEMKIKLLDYIIKSRTKEIENKKIEDII